MTELVVVEKVVEKERKFRREIPKEHRQSLDTRIVWLWNQRFGTIQMVWQHTPDTLDKLAATIILQAIMAKDLTNIGELFERIEGGPLTDDVIAEEEQEQGFQL